MITSLRTLNISQLIAMDKLKAVLEIRYTFITEYALEINNVG